MTSISHISETDHGDSVHEEDHYEDPDPNDTLHNVHDDGQGDGAAPAAAPPAAAPAAQQPWNDDDLFDNLEPPPPQDLMATVDTLFSTAPNGAGDGALARPHNYEFIQRAAMGTAGLPNILDPEGKVDRVALAYWTKGDFKDHFPSPKPDGGVRDTGITLTELVTIPAIQAVLTEYHLGQETIDRLYRDARLGGPITDTLNDRNKFHPTTNPRGFPSRFDRTLSCETFMEFRTGKVDAGCDLGCKTFVTKNGTNKGMVRLGCASPDCEGHRTMTHDDINKGAGGMIMASRVLIHYLCMTLANSIEMTYEERATRVAHILIRFTTLTWGQLRYEAIRRATSEQESLELSGTAAPSPSLATSSRGRGRGPSRGPSPRGTGRSRTPVSTPRGPSPSSSQRGGRIGPIRSGSSTIRRPVTTGMVTLSPAEAAEWRASQQASRASRRD